MNGERAARVHQRAGHAVDIAAGEDQCRRLGQRTAQAQHQPNDESGGRRWQQQGGECAAAREGQGGGTGAHFRGHGAQAFFGGTDEDGQNHAGECEATREDGEAHPQHHAEKGIAKQSEDDRGHARQHIEAAPHQAAKAGVAGSELREINGRSQA